MTAPAQATRPVWRIQPGLLLLFATACLFFGCRCGSRGSRARRGEFVVHMGNEPPHLNPLIQEGMWLARITVHNVFEGLVRRNPRTYRFEPALATGWRFSDGGRVVTFTLRQGVRFHDGRPFGVRDVIFTLDRLKDPKVTAGASRAQFTDLVSWKAVGSDEVRLTFRRPSFKILQAVSYLSILPRHVYGLGDLNRHPANDRPVGTGPFRFDRWKRGAYIRLKRFDGYWGTRPALEAVIYRLVKSREKAFALCQKGELDLLPRVAPQHACGPRAPINESRIQRRYRIIVHYPVQFYQVTFNLRRPLFSDARVRWALAMLINRKLIAEKIFCGRVRIISGPYWIEKKGYDHSVKPRPYDPGRAAALLAAAGWRDTDGDGVLDRDGRPFRFTYLQVAESSVQRRLLPILKEEFRKAGLQMVVEKLSWQLFLARVKQHRFDMTDFNWVSYYEQDHYQLYHSSQCHGGSNYGCFANPEADRLLATIRTTLDDAKRHALERQLHRLLHRDPPGIFLFNVGDVTLVSRRFENVYPSAEWYQVRDIRPVGGGR